MARHSSAFVLLSSLLVGASLGCSKPDAPPPVTVLEAGASVETGFDVNKQGFNFQNYGNEATPANLGPAEARRMFGDQVCAETNEGGCVLTPSAERWLAQMNDAMSGGHCEGMAVLSLLMQRGKVAPKDFGGESAHDLQLGGNAKLQREIAYWWSTQLVAPVAGSRVEATPSEIVDRLTAAFADKKETFTLAFFKPDGSQGHATTAYGVQDKGNGTVWILHYDNNFPNEERHIEVDRATNTWKYNTAANPSDPPEEYTGTAESKSLMIVPGSARDQRLVCPFCGDVTPGSTPPVGSKRQVYLDGDADLLVKDASGHKLGHDHGKLVSEIPGADYIVPFGYESSREEPVYEVPAGGALTVTLDGSQLRKESPSDVTLFGPGYVMGVYDVALDPQQQDEIGFSADWSDITYKTLGTESPVITLGVETPGPDYMIEVKVTGESAGQTIDLGIDAAKGLFLLQVHGAEGKTAYNVVLHKYDAGGEQTFEHTGLAIGSSDHLVFDYGTWKGNHQPLAIAVDKDGDGKPETRQKITDEK
jgi:hypothetical protein